MTIPSDKKKYKKPEKAITQHAVGSHVSGLCLESHNKHWHPGAEMGHDSHTPGEHK